MIGGLLTMEGNAAAVPVAAGMFVCTSIYFLRSKKILILALGAGSICLSTLLPCEKLLRFIGLSAGQARKGPIMIA